MRKLIAILLSGLLLITSVPVLAEQPVEKEKGKPIVMADEKVNNEKAVEQGKVKTPDQGKQTEVAKRTKPSTAVLGARRNATASYNQLKREHAGQFNDEDRVTLAVIADVADLTLSDLLARLAPAEGTTLTIDQLIAELQLDKETIDAEAAEIEAKLAEAEEEAAAEEGETDPPTEDEATDADGDETEPTDPEAAPGDDKAVELQNNVARYTALLEKDPDNRRIALKLARTYKELGQYDEAQAITDKLLAVNAEDKLANIVAGQVMAAQGLYDGAIAKYRAALTVENEPTTQVDLAEALDVVGQTTAAAEAMEQAAEQTRDPAIVKKAAKLQRKAGAKDVLVYVNGKRPAMDVPPVVKEGRTLVPFRALAQALNATVHWDEASKTITMERDGHVVVLTLDSLIATIDGQPVTLDVPAMLHNNRTLVPVRLLAMALDAQVDWDEETETVVVTPNEEEEETVGETDGEEDQAPAEDGTTATDDQGGPGADATDPAESVTESEDGTVDDTSATQSADTAEQV